MSTEKKDSNEVLLEEKQIKNAVIDLLHKNEEVTNDTLSKTTGLSTSSIKKHSEAINTMLSKLKKVYTTPNFKH